MFIATLVEKMYFVGGGDGDGGIDWDVGNSDSNDSLMVALEIFDFGS